MEPSGESLQIGDYVRLLNVFQEPIFQSNRPELGLLVTGFTETYVILQHRYVVPWSNIGLLVITKKKDESEPVKLKTTEDGAPKTKAASLACDAKPWKRKHVPDTIKLESIN